MTHRSKRLPKALALTERVGKTLTMTAACTLAFGLSAGPALAQAGYTLPTGTTTGFLQQVVTKMQELGSFTSSPLGAFVVLCGIIGAACCWVFAPKSGAVGMGLRAVSAGIAVFNIAAIISYLTFGTAA
jgi:hypothetical protein